MAELGRGGRQVQSTNNRVKGAEMNINIMPTNPTIAATHRGIIRASGLLHCACCGQPLQACAIEILPNGDILAICPTCHRSLFEIERR